MDVGVGSNEDRHLIAAPQLGKNMAGPGPEPGAKYDALISQMTLLYVVTHLAACKL